MIEKDENDKSCYFLAGIFLIILFFLLEGVNSFISFVCILAASCELDENTIELFTFSNIINALKWAFIFQLIPLVLLVILKTFDKIIFIALSIIFIIVFFLMFLCFWL